MLITLRREGYDVDAAVSGEQAVEILERKPFDLVITDLRMSGMNGIDVLKRIKGMSPDTEVVVMTAYGTIEGAVEAIKSGAYDYLTKPFQPEELTLIARRTLEKKGLAQRVRALEEAAMHREPIHGIVGTSQAIKDVMSIVQRVAKHEATVLITGESGTG
jgi:DNA-binding NtrC family response regulator